MGDVGREGLGRRLIQGVCWEEGGGCWERGAG